MEKFDTVSPKRLIIIEKCKLLLSKAICNLHSAELSYDEVSVGYVYRTVSCEKIDFFDRRILTQLADLVGDPVRGALAYSFDGDVCRILPSRGCEPEAYAAAAFSLFCDHRIEAGVPIKIISDADALYASVVGDTATLFH